MMFSTKLIGFLLLAAALSSVGATASEIVSTTGKVLSRTFSIDEEPSTIWVSSVNEVRLKDCEADCRALVRVGDGLALMSLDTTGEVADIRTFDQTADLAFDVSGLEPLEIPRVSCVGCIHVLYFPESGSDLGLGIDQSGNISPFSLPKDPSTREEPTWDTGSHPSISDCASKTYVGREINRQCFDINTVYVLTGLSCKECIDCSGSSCPIIKDCESHSLTIPKERAEGILIPTANCKEAGN